MPNRISFKEIDLSFSIKIILIILLCFSILSFFILGFRDYMKIKACRIHELEEDLEFLRRNCIDDLASRQRLEDECNLRKHKTTEDPSTFAFFDVIEKYSPFVIDKFKMDFIREPIFILYLFFISLILLLGFFFLKLYLRIEQNEKIKDLPFSLSPTERKKAQ